MQVKDTSVIVYIITNPFYRDENGKPIVKIGFAGGSTISDLEKRLKDLYSTGVPASFIINYAIVVENKRVEKLLHDIFADYRINQGREFFNVGLKMVKSALLLSGARFLKDYEVDGADTVEYDGTITPSYSMKDFTFEKINIPENSELIFKRNEKIICYSSGENKIMYNNEVYDNPLELAKILPTEDNRPLVGSGWLYFKYNNKTVYDIVKDWKKQTT